MLSGPRSVLVLAPESLGPSLTGPARRALKLAEVLAEDHRVTLAAPMLSGLPPGPFATLDTGPPNDQLLAPALSAHDIAVVQALPSPRQLLVALRNARHLVVDLIAPLALEVSLDRPGGRALARWRSRQLVSHLAGADLVLCTNTKQRDLFAGAALASGLDGVAERIEVVPHGLDPISPPPPQNGGALRTGELGGGDVRIVAWGGGMWGWLDPLTAVRAVEQLRSSRSDLRLVFLGFEHPDPEQRQAHASRLDEVKAYVRERRLDEAVLFRPRWLSHDEYLAHLAEADVGVSLHGPTLEGRFASRTRIVDYLAAGLQVVCSGGDAMSEFVSDRGLGRVVPPSDVAACADALDQLTDSDRDSTVGAQVLEPLLWRNVAAPLVEFCRDPGRGGDRHRALARVVVSEYPAFLAALVQSEGAAGVAGAISRRATARR